VKRSLEIESTDKNWIDNITSLVQDAVKDVASGLAHVSIPHTTAAIFLAEDDEELREDYLKIAASWLAGLRPFKHIRKNNPNTEAHVTSSAFGTQMTLAVENGKLDLGIYQNIMFLELDGPKKRTINVRVF